MLKPFTAYHNVWVEITKSEHEHGGSGWEFGTCLWSPVLDRGKARRYEIMREPKKGDLVIHFYQHSWPDGAFDTRICGRSIVSREAYIVEEQPPLAGNWSNLPPYYRIDLHSYEQFETQLPYEKFLRWYGDEVREELVEGRAKFHPFNTYGDGIRTAQGIYLAKCTQKLYDVLNKALCLEVSDAVGALENIPSLEDKPFIRGIDSHAQFAEERRMRREQFFFARNATLARRAKQHYGYQCQVCSFDFGKVYGSIGEQYIECHHTKPLSERSEAEWDTGIRTSLTDVVVLCANCHRMLHRRRPALTPDELRAVIGRNSS